MLMQVSSMEPKKLQQKPDLDRIDRHILRELCIDARQPNVRLAERVGLSASACLRRVQELEAHRCHYGIPGID